MTIFAGIDLLGKFYAGNDDQGNVGDRFENFVAQYFNTNHKNKTVIYQLRNSLLHSFCLYSKKYKFVLSQNLREFILHTSGTYIIDIRELHEQFESAVNTYCIDVNKNKNLQENFTKMFKDYGKIRIG
jgi:TFIIF-interacting CTD phosphatase-like protein